MKVDSSYEAFPLSWPSGWKRENCKEESRFNTTATKAYALLTGEVARMGGTTLIISTNVPLKQNGKMRLDRDPVDPGVAVYFHRKGKPVVFACDRFDVVRDNMLSVAKTIEALRGIERWGASDMMERAFSGFKALESGQSENWWEILKLSPDASKDAVEAAHKRLIRSAHPDVPGGSLEAAQRINLARDRAIQAVSA